MLNVLEGRLSPGRRAQTHWQAIMADVDEQIWRRRRKLRSFHHRSDWEQHVERTRQTFRAALGPLPEGTQHADEVVVALPIGEPRLEQLT